MDYDKSCLIMELAHPFTKEDLKKRYYKLALKYHPDKRNEDMDEKTQTEKFQTIFEAYSFLCNNYFEVENESEEVRDEVTDNYLSIFSKFLSTLSGIEIERKNVMEIIQEIIQFTSFKTFEKLDKETASKVFTYIEQYKDILMIGEDNISTLREKMRDKTKNDIIRDAVVTLDDLLDSTIADIEYNSSIFSIPLWHDEITFPLPKESAAENNSSDTTSVTFKCILENIPDHISIDENNNIHVNINLSLNNSILEREYIEIKIGKRIFKLSICELHVKKIQTYTFYNCGISRINTNDIYNRDKKGNVCVHISMKT
jgi:hypothetical protein